MSLPTSGWLKKFCFNAKVQRPATCNAIETMLVHEKVAQEFLPGIGKILQDAQVEIRGCTRTYAILKNIKQATDEDFITNTSTSF